MGGELRKPRYTACVFTQLRGSATHPYQLNPLLLLNKPGVIAPGAQPGLFQINGYFMKTAGSINSCFIELVSWLKANCCFN